MYGVVTELTDPPTIAILDAFASEDVATPCARATVPEQNPVFGEVESEEPAGGEDTGSSPDVGEDTGAGPDVGEDTDTSPDAGAGNGGGEIAVMTIAFVAVGALGLVSVLGDKIFPKSK